MRTAEVDLSWLDELPDMQVGGVLGVPGVPPQKSATSNGTPVQAEGVPGVLVGTVEHLGTPSVDEGVPAKSLNSKSEHREHLGTPVFNNAECQRWAERLQRLLASEPPACIAEMRWRRLLLDAETFVREWGDTALALGWDDIDLFSVSPGPERLLGTGGLVACLVGRPVLAMTDEAATIGNRSGAPNRRIKMHRPQSGVLLWSAEALRSIC
jgi:hypothetical protein